jgi:MFS family permease
MSKESKEYPTEKSMKASIIEGSFRSASSNMTSNYTTPYALSIGATNSQIGMIGAMQNLASTLVQLPGAKIPNYISRKTLSMTSIALQYLLWIPIILIAFLPIPAITALIIILALISALGSIRGPAWTSMIADIVPKDRRGEYFGKRNLITGLAGLVTMLVAGYILFAFGFGILFVLSIVVGMISLYWFSKITEPPTMRKFHYKHDFGMDVNRWKLSIKTNKPLVFFTIYMLIMTFGIAIASPFYAVYMLKVLNVDYMWYAIIITVNALVAIFSQPYWGKISDRYGDKTILVITGVMVCFIPFLWTFAESIPFIMFIQIYDGFLYGGWSLVIFNFLISACPSEKRTSYIANHTFIIGFASVLGTLLGGFMAEYVGMSVIFVGFTGLSVVFFISFLLRLTSLPFLHKIQACYVKAEYEPDEHLAWRVIVVEPARLVSQYFGKIYDTEWLKGKLRSPFTRASYQYRLYRADKR